MQPGIFLSHRPGKYSAAFRRVHPGPFLPLPLFSSFSKSACVDNIGEIAEDKGYDHICQNFTGNGLPFSALIRRKLPFDFARGGQEL
jgi:hypothetical protein